MTDTPSADLETRVQAARGTGRVRVTLIARRSLSIAEAADLRTMADTVAQAAGLRPLGAHWRALTPAAARAQVEFLLTRDLAYAGTLMEPDRAAAFADEFLELVGQNAVYWTNGEWPDSRTDGWGGSWTPATAATFDSGVAALGAEQAGILWIEDED